MQKCSLHHCLFDAYKDGLCQYHTHQIKAGRPMLGSRSKADAEERFRKLFTVSDSGCWDWNHPRYDGRAGTFMLDGHVMCAYRAAYLMFVGAIPKGKLVCHSCDNGRCVNPAHLWLGTYQDNNIDALIKGRRKIQRGEERGKGAKLTEAQVREIKLSIANGSSNGNRLAKKFGVNRRTVYDIIDGKTWSHVTLQA